MVARLKLPGGREELCSPNVNHKNKDHGWFETKVAHTMIQTDTCTGKLLIILIIL